MKNPFNLHVVLVDAGVGNAQGNSSETSAVGNVGSRVVGTVNVVMSDNQLLVSRGSR